MADLTKAEITELVGLDTEITALQRKMESDQLALRNATKKLNALLSKAQQTLVDSGKEERIRYGVRFFLRSKPGTVSWRKVVETLKSKEYAERLQAEAPTRTTIEYVLKQP